MSTQYAQDLEILRQLTSQAHPDIAAALGRIEKRLDRVEIIFKDGAINITGNVMVKPAPETFMAPVGPPPKPPKRSTVDTQQAAQILLLEVLQNELGEIRKEAVVLVEENAELRQQVRLFQSIDAGEQNELTHQDPDYAMGWNNCRAVFLGGIKSIASSYPKKSTGRHFSPPKSPDDKTVG